MHSVHLTYCSNVTLFNYIIFYYNTMVFCNLHCIPIFETDQVVKIAQLELIQIYGCKAMSI